MNLFFLIVSFLFFFQLSRTDLAVYAEATTGQSWAVVIGIDKYGPGINQRNYAVSDAQEVAKMLLDQGFSVRTFYHNEATRQAISKELGTNLSKQVGKEDKVLVYFSGHGQDVLNGEGQRMGYLLPVEADPEDLASTAISMGRVREWANFWRAKHVLFIVDSCSSGILGEQTKSPLTPLFLQQITTEKGRHLITACGGDQKPLEVGHWGQSLFAHFLLEGLRDKTADLNSDGIIPTSELYQFLDKRVFDEAISTGHKQRPEHWLLSPGQKGEFVFAGRKTPLSPLEEQQVTLAKVPTPSPPLSPQSVSPPAHSAPLFSEFEACKNISEIVLNEHDGFKELIRTSWQNRETRDEGGRHDYIGSITLPGLPYCGIKSYRSSNRYQCTSGQFNPKTHHVSYSDSEQLFEFYVDALNKCSLPNSLMEGKWTKKRRKNDSYTYMRYEKAKTWSGTTTVELRKYTPNDFESSYVSLTISGD